MSSPSTVPVPAVGAISPISTFSRLDFPAPFGPSRPMRPGSRRNVTSFSAWNEPYQSEICVRSSRGGVMSDQAASGSRGEVHIRSDTFTERREEFGGVVEIVETHHLD